MTDRNHTQTEFTKYRRTQIAEMADWVPGFDMARVSVSDADKEAGSPKEGDKIARNPANHADRWLVAADYFAVNFEPVDSLHTPAQEPRALGGYRALLTREEWVAMDEIACDNKAYTKKYEGAKDSVPMEKTMVLLRALLRVNESNNEAHRAALAAPPLAVQGGITEGTLYQPTFEDWMRGRAMIPEEANLYRYAAIDRILSKLEVAHNRVKANDGVDHALYLIRSAKSEFKELVPMWELALPPISEIERETVKRVLAFLEKEDSEDASCDIPMQEYQDLETVLELAQRLSPATTATGAAACPHGYNKIVCAECNAPTNQNTIPEMTDELGKHWRQPADIRQAKMDAKFVWLTEKQIAGLASYNSTMPSGVYPGKCWKREQANNTMLMWFGLCDDPKKCSTNAREILPLPPAPSHPRGEGV